MSFLSDIFGNKKSNAATAKDRLMLVLATERAVNVPYMEQMKEEILAVIKKYTNAQSVNIRTDSNQNFKTLEVEVVLDNK